MVVTMSEQQKVYQIPKLPYNVSGCRKKIGDTSRTYMEILQTIKAAYFDSSYVFEDNWTVSSVEQVINQEFEKAYQEKRQELRSELNSSSVGEQFAFAIVDSEEKVNDACQSGIFSGHEMLTSMTLGKRSQGVHVWLYADVPLQWATKNIYNAYLIIYKVIRGRAKQVMPAVNNNIEPTPNYECHVSRVTPKATAQFGKLVNTTQIFIYEYDEDCLPSKHPRHCYPYAVVGCARANDLLPWKKSKPRKPRKKLSTHTSKEKDSISIDDQEPVTEPAGQLQEFIVIDEYTCENSNPQVSDEEEFTIDIESKDYETKLKKITKKCSVSLKKVSFSSDLVKNTVTNEESTKENVKQPKRKRPCEGKKAPKRRRFRKRDRWRKNYKKIVGSRSARVVKDSDDFGIAAEYSRSLNSEYYQYMTEEVTTKKESLRHSNGECAETCVDHLLEQYDVQSKPTEDSCDLNNFTNPSVCRENVFEYNHTSIHSNDADINNPPAVLSNDQNLTTDNFEVLDMEVSSPEPTGCGDMTVNVQCNVNQDENGRLYDSHHSGQIDCDKEQPMQSQRKMKKHFHGKKLLTEHDADVKRLIPLETPEDYILPADPRMHSEYCVKKVTDFSVLYYATTRKSSISEGELTVLNYSPSGLSLKEKELIRKDYEMCMLKRKCLSLLVKTVTSPTESNKENSHGTSEENLVAENINQSERHNDTYDLLITSDRQHLLLEARCTTTGGDNVLKDSTCTFPVASNSVTSNCTNSTFVNFSAVEPTEESNFLEQKKAFTNKMDSGLSKRPEINHQSLIAKCFKENRNHLPKLSSVCKTKKNGKLNKISSQKDPRLKPRSNGIVNTEVTGAPEKTKLSTEQSAESNADSQDNNIICHEVNPRSSFKDELLKKWQEYNEKRKDNIVGNRYILMFLKFCGLDYNQTAVLSSVDGTSNSESTMCSRAASLKEHSTAKGDNTLISSLHPKSDNKLVGISELYNVQGKFEPNTFDNLSPVNSSDSFFSTGYNQHSESGISDQDVCFPSKPIVIKQVPVIDSVSNSMIISETSESYLESDAKRIENLDEQSLKSHLNTGCSFRSQESFSGELTAKDNSVEHKNKLKNPFKRLPEDLQSVKHNHIYVTDECPSKSRVRCKKRNPPKDKVMGKSDLRQMIESRKRRASDTSKNSSGKRYRVNSRHEDTLKKKVKKHNHSNSKETKAKLHNNEIDGTLQSYRRASSTGYKEVKDYHHGNSSVRDYNHNEYSNMRIQGDYRNEEPYMSTKWQHTERDDHCRNMPVVYNSRGHIHHIHRSKRSGYHQDHY